MNALVLVPDQRILGDGLISMYLIQPGIDWTRHIIPKSMLQQEDETGDVSHAEARSKS